MNKKIPWYSTAEKLLKSHLVIKQGFNKCLFCLCIRNFFCAHYIKITAKAKLQKTLVAICTGPIHQLVLLLFTRYSETVLIRVKQSK